RRTTGGTPRVRRRCAARAGRRTAAVLAETADEQRGLARLELDLRIVTGQSGLRGERDVLLAGGDRDLAAVLDGGNARAVDFHLGGHARRHLDLHVRELRRRRSRAVRGGLVL